ncbi:MAG: hypothetical protein Q9227_003362 [Pyrenula ochraceoflavens]
MGSLSSPSHRTQLIDPTFSSHFWTYIEERLYLQALTTLLSLLTPSSSPLRPLLLPSSHHLSLLATLAIHPSLTTRTSSAEKHDAAATALRVLRLVRERAGVSRAGFAGAFRFESMSATRLGTRRKGQPGAGGAGGLGRSGSTRSMGYSGKNGEKLVVDEEEGGDEEEDGDYKPPESIELAHSGSIWACAEDFWHVVGWVFNCSVRHQERWERWCPWLEFVCQVLEDDWRERTKGREDGPTIVVNGIMEEEEDIPEDALIVQYIRGAAGGSGKVRRIMRAIFADGESKSENEFNEVFRNELKGPKVEGDKVKKREVDVNIEADVYGDYLAADEGDESSDEQNPAPVSSTKRSLRRRGGRNGIQQQAINQEGADNNSNDEAAPGAGRISDQDDHLGSPTSLTLRIRLLSLLSGVSDLYPSVLGPWPELFTLFVEFIKPLPLPTFSTFVLPSTLSPHFPSRAHTFLCEYLLYRLLEDTSLASDDEPFTQEKLENWYLPWAAAGAGVVENAKVSLLVESLLRNCARERGLMWSELLRGAVEDGIDSRIEKVEENKGRKGNAAKGEDLEYAWAVLCESGERMRDLVGRHWRF